ncbi:Bbp16 family capsid cement protein [Paraburkholderia sediminicola]|uniref:Bbp16 family capsid cement protein n=1 Tax=Paraburkholderia sediminicola TaxID=458836 RepID=UPI0038BA621A
MLLDSQALFSDAQAVTTTANSSNVVDAGPQVGLIGQVGESFVFARIGTAFAGGTSLAVSLVTADDTALTTNLTTHFSTGPIVLASLTAKALIMGNRIPPQKLRRYMGLIYTVVGTMTAGTITAGVVENLNSIQLTTDFVKQFTV